MKSLNKNKNLIFSLIISIIFFSLLVNTNSSLSDKLRNLIEEKEVKDRCDKTLDKFKKKYSKSPEFVSNNTNLDKYEKVLKDIIVKEKYEKIKNYLPKIVISLIIAVIGVIFIIIWILFCCYACKDVDKQNNIGCGAKCAFFIYFILCIGIIGFCIVGYIYIPYLNKTLNGTSCATYKLVFDFLEGTNGTFIDSNWTGLIELEATLSNYSEFSYGLSKVQSIINDLNGNKKHLDTIEKIMSKWDKLNPYILIPFFAGLFFFNLFSLISLFFLFVCNCKCMSCFFHFFWNIEIILIIVTFFLSSILQACSVVSKDVSKILINQKNSSNILDIENNFIFEYNNINDLIDLCLNGNGDLYNYIFDEFGGKKFCDLNYNNDCSDSNYENLIDTFNCTFFRTDYNVLIDELKNSLSKKLYFMSLILIIIDAAGIVSIFFGILVYNSQKEFYPSQTEQANIYNNNRMMNNRIDLSTENLKKQNNEIIFPKYIK